MQEFALGAVVVPATDGTLKSLGHSVTELGERALGFVLESRGGKALVQFPEIKLTLWLDKNELADVGERAAAGEAAYLRLVPDENRASRERNLAWIVRRLVAILEAKFILGCEQGESLNQLWSDPYQKIDEFFSGDQKTPAAVLSLGLPELTLERWHQAEAYLGEELCFARFLPAGMHKLELALYVRR